MIERVNKIKWGVSFLIVLTTLMLGGGVVFCLSLSTEQRYGLSLATAVSHEAFARDEDRVRLVIRPEFLLPYLEHYLPEEGESSAMGPSSAELFRELLPREIALLARSDLSTGKIHLTLFANESRGGPYIQARINRANVLAQLSGIEWITDGLELPERGVLIAQGSLVLPASSGKTEFAYWPIYNRKLVKQNSQWVTEATLLEYWPERVQNPPVTSKGNHFVEVVVDNTNGDILTFFAVVAAVLGEDWSRVVCYLFPLLTFVGPVTCYHSVEAALSMILPTFNALCFTMELQDKNTILISILIKVPLGSWQFFEFYFSHAVFPQLGSWLHDNFNLILDGSLRWDETQDHIVGTYTLSGIQPILKDIIGSSSTLFRDNDAMFNLVYRLNTLFQN